MLFINVPKLPFPYFLLIFLIVCICIFLLLCVFFFLLIHLDCFIFPLHLLLKKHVLPHVQNHWHIIQEITLSRGWDQNYQLYKVDDSLVQKYTFPCKSRSTNVLLSTLEKSWKHQLTAKFKILRKWLQLWQCIDPIRTTEASSLVILFYDTPNEHIDLSTEEWNWRIILKERLIKLVNLEKI